MAVEYDTLAQTLKVLAHPVRLQILDMLRSGELCVCHFENALDRRQAYISQQLMALREAGFVESRKDGLRVYYRLSSPSVAAVVAELCGPAPSAAVEVVPDCPCPYCADSSHT